MSSEEGISFYVFLGLGFSMLYLAIRLTPRRRTRLEGQELEVFTKEQRRSRELKYGIFNDMVRTRKTQRD